MIWNVCDMSTGGLNPLSSVKETEWLNFLGPITIFTKVTEVIVWLLNDLLLIPEGESKSPLVSVPGSRNTRWVKDVYQRWNEWETWLKRSRMIHMCFIMNVMNSRNFSLKKSKKVSQVSFSLDKTRRKPSSEEFFLKTEGKQMVKDENKKTERLYYV